MTSAEEQTGFMSGQASPLEPVYFTRWCESCQHAASSHGKVIGSSPTGPHYCRGAYGDTCECTELRREPIAPAMHRINRSYRPEGILHLTSYSSAYLWDGSSKYASHYA